MCVELTLNKANVIMEVDTGASVSLLSESTYRRLWPAVTRPPLLPSDARLHIYSGELIKVLVTTSGTVHYRGQVKQLPLLIVPTDGPSLLGRDGLQEIVLDRKLLNKVHYVRQRALQDVLDQYADLFKPGMGAMNGTTAKIHIRENVCPRFFRARPVPYAVSDKVTSELDRLRKAGVIKPVQFADWATPIVPVLKPDGTLRLCGDYKQTVNRAAIPDKYPLPKIDDFLASLSAGKSFTKLDLAHAYQQVLLDDESSLLTTINIHRGLFKY